MLIVGWFETFESVRKRESDGKTHGFSRHSYVLLCEPNGGMSVKRCCSYPYRAHWGSQGFCNKQDWLPFSYCVLLTKHCTSKIRFSSLSSSCKGWGTLELEMRMHEFCPLGNCSGSWSEKGWQGSQPVAELGLLSYLYTLTVSHKGVEAVKCSSLLFADNMLQDIVLYQNPMKTCIIFRG